MTRGIDLSTGVPIQAPKKVRSATPVSNKLWNSQSYTIGAMMGNISSILFSVFAIAEELVEDGHQVKIDFVFDEKQLHGLVTHTSPAKDRIRHGFADIGELMQIGKMLLDTYLHNKEVKEAMKQK